MGAGAWVAADALRRLRQDVQRPHGHAAGPAAPPRALGRVYAQALIDGETVRAAARHCGVHKNTSFRWRQRFLALPADVKPSCLHGIVEADETYFLESHKGERHLSRPPRKRGGSATKRGLSDEQIPVLVVRDRSASTTDAVLPKANTAAVTAVLGPIVDPDAVLCSDSAAIYRSFAEAAHIAHTAVNLSPSLTSTFIFPFRSSACVG